MILDWQNGASQSGFGHPSCKGGNQSDAIIHDLSNDLPTGPHRRGARTTFTAALEILLEHLGASWAVQTTQLLVARPHRTRYDGVC
jgi:hypothetical protein